MKTFKTLLIELKACEDSREWAGDKTIDEVVDTCPRGDWLLWLAEKVGMDLRLLTLAKGHCAATVLHLMKDEQSRGAVKAAIDFGEGNISRDELDAVADAASYASYAGADAAHTAAYAAYYASSADAAYAAAAYAAYAAAAYAADDDADDARKKNQMQTADICRRYIGEEIKRLVKIDTN